MLLGTPEWLAERAAVARASLAPLADSLDTDLRVATGRELYLPSEKALLSRAGGRCERDGADLEFDPFSPHQHRCPSCGTVFSGNYHDRRWIYPYQLWLAERVLQAAVLARLRDDASLRLWAERVLDAWTNRYLDFPNRDNVLGPSRIFFSTYLESLWLLHVCLAADFMGAEGAPIDRLRERVVLPALELIEAFHEGMSNRQVWNAAAIVAGRRLLGGRGDSDVVAGTLADVESTILQAVGSDGAWYEGENYHQFAHRGLWYLIALGERAGYAWQDETLRRFDAGFGAHFRSVLPDFTFPSRKDSRYAVSLRQWRFAESCELGLARTDDPVLHWALGRMYDDSAPAGDANRWRSTGEAEMPAPGVRLTRANLGWKTLLFARPVLDLQPGAAPESCTIASQGLSIHRRDQGSVYVALDWGASGGGHGHPDRLNLLFAHGTQRWLDDLGTASYVDPSLHWFRSTLAHNAPLVNGRSQTPAAGTMLGSARGGRFHACCAECAEAAPGVQLVRTIVTGDTYFVDELRWSADRDIQMDLPVHFDADPPTVVEPGALTGGDGLEDGFAHVTGARSARVAAATPLSLRATRGGQSSSATVWCSAPATWFTAFAPGPPPSAPQRFHVLRASGSAGVVRTVWSWTPDRVRARFAGDLIEVRVGSRIDVHEPADDGWSIEIDGKRELHLQVPRLPSGPEPSGGSPQGASGADAATAPADAGADAIVIPWQPAGAADPSSSYSQDRCIVFELGRDHYRRSEPDWHEAGSPVARIAMAHHGESVLIDVDIATDHPVLVEDDAENPFDNEHADINGHGVQLFVRAGQVLGAWVLTPRPSAPDVRVRAVPGWNAWPAPTGHWQPGDGGLAIGVTLPLPPAIAPDGRFWFDVIVNDAAPGRARRRGQLVLSGGRGEFVYLRGDRHDPGRLLPFALGAAPHT